MVDKIQQNREVCHRWTVVIVEGKLTRDVEALGKMDPYVVFKCNGREVRTNTDLDAGKIPKWNKKFDCQLPDTVGEATFECWDAGAAADEIIGSGKVELWKLSRDKEENKTVELFFNSKPVGTLTIKSLLVIDRSQETEDELKGQITAKKNEIKDLMT
jgi:Ca2+-dependent lipid-binding protein